ncbi:ABC transporter ATP-binding protein [Aquihabitans sp. McL0605]|uniref:ABC transporter ATP-binding protein n=1 Tax=Aquihabitans sp. McL0605 TaxID=3415671 RepID=UPI003CFB563C
MPALEVSDLIISYGNTRAVNGLTFSAEAGEVLAVLGPNGAGKTSTIECLEGYRRPTSGQVRVLGLDPIAQHDQLVPQIGVMLQAGGVYPGIRPIEALELHAAFYRDPADPTELLERVGLTHVRRNTWRHMSGGEQQRLSLALALVGKPRVAFLDEPTAGVDVQGRQLIRRTVRELAHDGVCVVLTTHDLDEAEKVSDRVVIIDRGHLITVGTPDELMAAGGSREIRFGAPAGIDTAALGKVMLAAVHERSPGEYLIETEPSPANIAALTSWLAEKDLALADIRAGRQTLEDVFLRMTTITGEVPAVRLDQRPPETAKAKTDRLGRGRRRPGAA